MEIPPPDPKKLLDHWMEWEKGDVAPGELLKQLKMGGMRTLLDQLAAGVDTSTGADTGPAATAATAETVGDLLES